MKRQQGWLIALAVAALLVSACGPQMATPTPKVAQAGPTATGLGQETTATAVAVPTQAQPTAKPLDVTKLPVDENDWHAIGPADAAVTVIEYSDFQ
jgi:hypothetical protein